MNLADSGTQSLFIQALSDPPRDFSKASSGVRIDKCYPSAKVNQRQQPCPYLQKVARFLPKSCPSSLAEKTWQ
jgi:hypothetical protein